MLIEFKNMTEEEKYRLTREVYDEKDEREIAYFVTWLQKFFADERTAYYVLEEKGTWVSTVRLTRLDDFYYLEALETPVAHRKKGYAYGLISEVIELLRTRGSVVIRSNIAKDNKASLATQMKCGFVIERDPAYNYVTGITRENFYGMIYEDRFNENK